MYSKKLSDFSVSSFGAVRGSLSCAIRAEDKKRSINKKLLLKESILSLVLKIV
jgi:hypothetical protein